MNTFQAEFDELIARHYGFCMECRKVTSKELLHEMGTDPVDNKEYHVCDTCLAQGY